MRRRGLDLCWAWKAALVLFLLAGATGALYRFGLISGFPAGLQAANVRHAHSHLMYFGWATPALMALIATRLPALTGRPLSRWAGRVVGATLVAALLAYPPFLAYGYEPAEVAGRRLPLGVMAAIVNMIAWYAYAALYVAATWKVARSRALRLWDAALAFQALASLGAWGRGALVALKVEDPFWGAAAVHLFLDLFSDGWFVLALLGLLYATYPALSGSLGRWGARLVIAGLPLTVVLGIPVGLVPRDLRLLAGAGGILVALGLLATILELRPAVREERGAAWRVPVAFLGLKALAGLGVSIPAVALWAERMGLRISYLHWLLLGFVTLGLVAAATDAWGPVATRGRGAMTVAVLLLLATLIPLTGLWPSAWMGRWVLLAATWATLGPLLVALWMVAGRDGGRHRSACPERAPAPSK